MTKEGVLLEKIVAIIDDMPEYARQLAVYLNGRRSFPYRAVVFPTVAEARGYVEGGAVYAILAVEAMEKEVLGIALHEEVKLFWMTETKEVQSASSLYRYRSAREIEKKLTEQREIVRKAPVIGFFSPAGAAECELLSRKIAEQFGKKGRVLYLPFFRFGIYGRGLGDGMSEVLFYVKQRETELFPYLYTVLQKEECMDAVGPVRWYTDLTGLTGEDIKHMLHCIETNTDYGFVLAAVGQFDAAGKAILDCCDSVLVPVWETEAGQKIQEEFLRQLRESGETTFYSRVIEVSVRGTTPTELTEAAVEAARKGGEAFAGNSGGNQNPDIGAVQFFGGADR